MFNKNFYPTSVDTLDQMGIDCYNKTVLEPEAGKGDIVDYLKDRGAKQVIVCELDPDLAEIVKTKGRFLKHDFLKVVAAEISQIDLIVMNPPFSHGVKHVLHAWEIAPAGCEIIALINAQNLENDYSRDRKELNQIINDYGNVMNIGSVFADAQRKTNVETGLIKLYKPKTADSQEFDDFFMDEDPDEAQENGIMKFNFVRDVVQRYVNSVKCFDEHLVISQRMNSLTTLFNVGTFSFSIGHDQVVYTKEDFKKQLQKKSWQYLFNEMKLGKYVTSGVMKDVNSFVENQTKVPFTMKNVYKMFEIIIGTRETTFKRSLVEAVDKFTEHTHENRYFVEGWKTNARHLLNQKFIIPYIVKTSWSGKKIEIARSTYVDQLDDLIKVISSIEGKNYDDIIDLNRFFRYPYALYSGECFIEKVDEFEWGFDDDLDKLKGVQKSAQKKGIQCDIRETRCEFGQWLDWGFFEIKCFKKGTMHLKFKDEETWARINQQYAKIKGMVLPEIIKTKANKSRR